MHLVYGWALGCGSVVHALTFNIPSAPPPNASPQLDPAPVGVSSVPNVPDRLSNANITTKNRVLHLPRLLQRRWIHRTMPAELEGPERNVAAASHRRYDPVSQPKSSIGIETS